MKVASLPDDESEGEDYLKSAWPPDRPLPLPSWGRCAPLTLHVATVEAYEDLASCMELQVQQLLQAHHYNTVGNFVRMYEEFAASGETRLESFFRGYRPPITPDHHTCVGLGLELLQRLRALDPIICPGLADKLHLAIESPGRYMSEGAPPLLLAEKEHVLVALRVCVAGRPGVVLLDPGYHVARVVTVMADGQYPHTGWFTQKEDNRCLKEYCYTLDSRAQYVVWHIQETSRPSGLSNEMLSLIYVERPFLSAVECAERRNLVYSFKSLLSRDTKGHVLAGFYFSLEPGEHVTLFCQDDDGGQLKRKLTFSTFLKAEIAESTLELVEQCAEQLRMQTTQELLTLLSRIARIMADPNFMKQVLEINEKINEIAADN
ncbi:hypothetical protein B566_EDAN012157 [Ephemera danica]|nr:hypothetical protein B566_EDAN012157 [Ephemera danica]